MGNESKKDSLEVLRHDIRTTIENLRQTFPYLVDGLETESFSLDFSRDSNPSNERAIASTTYRQGSRSLEKLTLNRHVLIEHYGELNDYSTDIMFTDIVRFHVGVSVALDMLFKHMLSMQEGASSSVPSAMYGFLSDHERPVTQLRELLRERHGDWADRAITQLILNGRQSEGMVELNAYRIAVGMVGEAEKINHKTTHSTMLEAFTAGFQQHYLTATQANFDLSYVFTQGNLDVSADAVAEHLISRDLPFVIPAKVDEIMDLFSIVDLASGIPSLTHSDIIDLSDGFTV